MRVAVYNRHWLTVGGGERFAGGIADVLSEDHDVTLLSHEAVDLDDLAERLQLDLSRVRLELVGPAPEALTRASSRFDLFVNASYGSDDVAAAPRSLYVVHFPVLPPFHPGRVRRLAISAAARLAATAGVEAAPVHVVDGAYMAENVAGLPVRWTDGEAVLDVPGDEPLTVVLGRLQPPAVGDLPLAARVGGRVVAATVVRVRRSRLDPLLTTLRVPPIGPGRHRLRLSSTQWWPAARGAPDGRGLGVALVAVLAGRASARMLQAGYQLAAVPTATAAFLQSYDRVVSNSEYTRGWVERLWGRSSTVLHPPVVGQVRGSKSPLILGVGRFFEDVGGHGKRQVELVRAFAALRQQAPGAAGWELALAGSCDVPGQSYLERVRREAAQVGPSVQLHPNATGAELRGLYARASLFWHATGLGADLERHPERSEHFGITTVEAMSAGAVPIVIARAGQLELFEDGRAGMLWNTLDELVSETRQLVDDPTRRTAMADAAVAGAQRFLRPAFSANLRRLIDEMTSISR